MKVYFDTAQWIILADGRTNADRFREALAVGLITPVLSFTHLLEFSYRTDPPSRKRLTGFVDQLQETERLLWIPGLDVIQRLEVAQAFTRWVGVPPPAPALFAHKPGLVIRRWHSPPVPEHFQDISVTNLCEAIRGIKAYESHLQVKQVVPDLRKRVRALSWLTFFGTAFPRFLRPSAAWKPTPAHGALSEALAAARPRDVGARMRPAWIEPARPTANPRGAVRPSVGVRSDFLPHLLLRP